MGRFAVCPIKVPKKRMNVFRYRKARLDRLFADVRRQARGLWGKREYKTQCRKNLANKKIWVFYFFNTYLEICPNNTGGSRRQKFWVSRRGRPSLIVSFVRDSHIFDFIHVLPLAANKFLRTSGPAVWSPAGRWDENSLISFSRARCIYPRPTRYIDVSSP